MKIKRVILWVLGIFILLLLGIAVYYSILNRDKFMDGYSTSASNELEEIKKIVPGENVISVTTYAELETLLKREDITFLVLGRTGCHFCEQYRPVIEATAKEYHFEIVYIDLAAFSKEDYYTFMNSKLTIPSKCTDSGQEIPLSQGFGTPLTLFVQNETSIDCIRGYKDTATLAKLLKNNGYVK